MYDTPSDACATKSNLCWTSSNGYLSSSWSTNVLSSDGSNCSNVCDHNSQEAACTDEQKTCYTYSNNSPDSRSGTISNSEHTFTYNSDNSNCDNPCDSSSGLYESSSNACATKSNICYTLSGTTVNSNYVVNTLSNDGSNCVDSCTGYQTGQQACDTLSNLCYSLDDGALNSNYETYTYSNGRCVAPTPCSNADDFGICLFPASNDPSLSWSNIGSSDTECDSTNIGTQKVRTFNQQATVSQSNDGNCQYDSSARNTYTRTVTSNLDENCTPYLAGTFTASYNSAQSKITVSGNLNGSIYDDDTFITMQIENGEFSYRSAALRTPFVFNDVDVPSDTDNYDGKKLSLRLENLINGVTHISNTISNIEIELDRETSCRSQTGTCWLLDGTSLTSESVSKTWNGSSCVTSCTPNYLSANAACASLTNTCYSVSNYETIVTSSSTMVPDSTQCIPQNTCTYTGSFTISIDSVVARVNASLDLMFDNTLTTPNAQFYIVKTANQREVKLYEATNGKYLYINNSKCTLSGSSSTFKIFKTGTNKQYHVKNVLGEWWGNLFGTNKQGTFTQESEEKTIITTRISIDDQFLSEYNVDCMFELVSDIGNSDRCLSESCVRTKQIKLRQKPSGDGLTCSNFITRTYGDGFSYNGNFADLSIDQEIEITADCDFGDATDRDCCTSNDIFYKFEAYYNTQFSIPGSINQIILKSSYDRYNYIDTFTVTLLQNTGYDDLDYTFTKAQWENNELPYLDSTNMGQTWIPNQIKLTKTYGHPDNPSCRSSILDNLPYLEQPIFKNISTTSPLRLCDSTNPNHYTTPAQYLYMNGNTVSDSREYETCASNITRHRQWNTEACRPPDDALSNNGQYYDSNGLECFEVDADFIDGLLGLGSTKYALGYSFTIDTRTKVKIGGTSSVVLDTQFEHTYVWKVFKKTGSSFGTPIAQWTNNDSSYSIFEQESLTLNTFIDTVDNSDSKHNKTYKIEVSVTRISDGYIPDTKSIQFKYFQYQMNVGRVVDNVSYNNNTLQLTINLKTGTDYQSGHWGEAKTQIQLYSSMSDSIPDKQKLLNTKTSSSIIFNQVSLSPSQQTIYLQLYHQETYSHSLSKSYSLSLCDTNLDGSYLYGNPPFTTSSSIDAYSNCLTSITRYSEFQSNCVLPPYVITKNGKHYDPDSGVQCEQPYTLGPIDNIRVSYNVLSTKMEFKNMEDFFREINGGTTLIVKINNENFEHDLEDSTTDSITLYVSNYNYGNTITFSLSDGTTTSSETTIVSVTDTSKLEAPSFETTITDYYYGGRDLWKEYAYPADKFIVEIDSFYNQYDGEYPGNSIRMLFYSLKEFWTLYNNTRLRVRLKRGTTYIEIERQKNINTYEVGENDKSVEYVESGDNKSLLYKILDGMQHLDINFQIHGDSSLSTVTAQPIKLELSLVNIDDTKNYDKKAIDLPTVTSAFFLDYYVEMGSSGLYAKLGGNGRLGPSVVNMN